jgi:hypothetical protein
MFETEKSNSFQILFFRFKLVLKIEGKQKPEKPKCCFRFDSILIKVRNTKQKNRSRKQECSSKTSFTLNVKKTIFRGNDSVGSKQNNGAPSLTRKG